MTLFIAHSVCKYLAAYAAVSQRYFVANINMIMRRIIGG